MTISRISAPGLLLACLCLGSASLAQAQARGTGTLHLGGTAYDFAVRACDFSGETDGEVYQTLSGRGTLPSGERFEVIASRNAVEGKLVHTVTFYTGDVLRGQGTVLEAQRLRLHGTWLDLVDGPDEPLIHIRGNRLRVRAPFIPPEGVVVHPRTLAEIERWSEANQALPPQNFREQFRSFAGFVFDVADMRDGALEATCGEGPPPFFITKHLPERGRENVDWVRPELVVTFSDTVSAASIRDGGQVFLRYPDPRKQWITIYGVAEPVDPLTLRFVPEVDLDPAVIYEVLIRGGPEGVRSRAGGQMDEDFAWRFSTVVRPDSVVPHVFQTARNAPLVATKPTLTRVYTYWEPHEHVHDSWQVKHFPARVNVLDAARRGVPPYAEQEVRIHRPDVYGREEARRALNSVNFFGWRPPRTAPPAELIARVEPKDPYPAASEQHRVEGGRHLSHWSGQPRTLSFDYYLLNVGEWSEQTTFEAHQDAHRIAAEAEIYTTQTFPVVATRGNFRGEVMLSIPWLAHRQAAFWEGVGVPGELARLVGRYFHDHVSRFSSADVTVGFVPRSFRSGGQALFDLKIGNLHEFFDPKWNPTYVFRTVLLGISDSVHLLSALTHEFGHVYDLRHTPNPEGRGAIAERAKLCAISDARHEGIEGFRIAPGGRHGWNKSYWEGNGESTSKLFGLMYPCARETAGGFILNRDYQVLLDAFAFERRSHQRSAPSRAPHLATRTRLRGATSARTPVMLASLTPFALARSTPLPPGSSSGPSELRQQGVLISGFIRGDEVAVLPIRTLDDTAESARSSAGPSREAYSVRLKDASGRTVATLPFEVDEESAVEGWQYFGVVGTSRVAVAAVDIRRGGRVLETIRRSASPPAVGFVSPSPEAEVGGRLRIRWRGSDADGDRLRYTLLYSPDGETGWSAVALHLAADSIEAETSPWVRGPRPTLRIVASDGFHEAHADLAIRLARALSPRNTLPAEGDTTAAQLDVLAFFQADLDPSRFGEESFTLIDDRGAEVSADIEYRPEARVAVLTPHRPLAPDATYTARLRAGLTDRFGNRMPSDHTWSFRTEAAAPAPAPPVAPALADLPRPEPVVVETAEPRRSAPAPRPAREAPAPPPAPPAPPSPASGSGTLRVGDLALHFEVTACELGERAVGPLQRLAGRGTTPDGSPFTVAAVIIRADDMLMHEIQVELPSPGREKELWVARIGGRDGIWFNVDLGQRGEPLLQLEGSRLTGRGPLLPQSATLTRPPSNAGAAAAALSARTAAAREAVLEATCGN
jgi:hypothetical protein